MPLHFKSLQQRVALFMLLPVGILLIAGGSAGFLYARNRLLEQWRQTAILELQRQAHSVDMLLSRPKHWIDKLYDESRDRWRGEPHIQHWIINQLRTTEGVIRVDLESLKENAPSTGHLHGGGMRSGAMAEGRAHDEGFGAKAFHGSRFSEITPPRYDPLVEYETVSLVSDLTDENGQVVGRITAIIRFDHLFRDLHDSELWQDYDAFLVDEAGRIIYHRPAIRGHGNASSPPVAVDQAILNAIRNHSYGTVMSDGLPPVRISGFYRLAEAPWTLVISAPGNELLAPIHRFGILYFLAGTVIIALVLILIRSVTGESVAAIKKVSAAAEDIAGGRFDTLLPVRSADEIGELTRSFNAMIHQLKEREKLKRAMNLAMEVQQNFLPQHTLRFSGLEIAGRSIYCDETGGDYYDFIRFPQWPSDRIGIAVGDVVGHGVAAALLMATTRALLRNRTALPGCLAEVVADVNGHLSWDSRESVNFVSLFYALIDVGKRSIQWVRAGHDPALLYDPASDSFRELQGKGMALGVDAQAQFNENRFVGFNDGQILLIGTDGIWEAQNLEGQSFGKERLRRVIRESCHESAEQILENIVRAIDQFRQQRRIQDDITMVVVRLADPASHVAAVGSGPSPISR